MSHSSTIYSIVLWDTLWLLQWLDLDKTHSACTKSIFCFSAMCKLSQAAFKVNKLRVFVFKLNKLRCLQLLLVSETVRVKLAPFSTCSLSAGLKEIITKRQFEQADVAVKYALCQDTEEYTSTCDFKMMAIFYLRVLRFNSNAALLIDGAWAPLAVNWDRSGERDSFAIMSNGNRSCNSWGSFQTAIYCTIFLLSLIK